MAIQIGSALVEVRTQCDAATETDKEYSDECYLPSSDHWKVKTLIPWQFDTAELVPQLLIVDLPEGAVNHEH